MESLPKRANFRNWLNETNLGINLRKERESDKIYC